jgi:hypothetical protein
VGVIDGGHDLVGVGAGCVGPSATRGDLVGTVTTPIDALLGPLAASGPTPVAVPAPGSPAIDAGDPATPGSGGGACEPTDQRGALRPIGARCDIGAVEVSGPCVPDDGTLCLQGGRFEVRARFSTAAGEDTRPAAAEAFTDQAGYFTFFGPENVEVTVKVLDACTFNGRFWVFHAGMTDVHVELTVTDTATGRRKSYANPLHRRYRTVTDTAAFRCD